MASRDHAPSITALTSGRSHTPGTWVHRRPTGAVKTQDGTLVASVYGDHPECKEDDRQIANARLIAAAPELLSALQDLVALVRGECPRLLDEDSGGDAILDERIDAAIAKASA